jgi:hypothetical protein
MVKASRSEFPIKRKKDTKNKYLVRHGGPEKKTSRKCASWEPKPGHSVGNDVFCH